MNTIIPTKPTKNKYTIQIPNKLIEDKQISVDATYLYTKLKILSDYKTSTVTIRPINLLTSLGWYKDNTTPNYNKLKKYLQELKQLKYIHYDFERMPTNKAINIKLTNIPKTNFTQITKDALEQIAQLTNNTVIELNKETGETTVRDLKEYAVRLYLLYRKFYNISTSEKQLTYTWLKYENIRDMMKIQNNYIKAINTILNKNKIVEVDVGGYKETDKGTQFYSNKYIPLI